MEINAETSSSFTHLKGVNVCPKCTKIRLAAGLRSQDFNLRGSKIRGRGQARAGEEVLGNRGSQPFSNQLGDLEVRCRLPQRGSGEAQAASVFLYVMDTIVYVFTGTGILVASGHVPVAKYFSAIHHVSAYPQGTTLSPCNRFLC